MSALLKTVESKDSCLAGWCRERVTALANIVTQWEQLQPLIDNHSAALRMQAEIVRNQIEFQLTNLKDETEKFQIRWESTINDLENNEESNLQLFKERLQNWNTISQQKYKLERNCKKYMVDFSPDIEQLFVKIADDVGRMGHQWEIFEEFSTEYQSVTAEEWTVYRRRPYILTDFISKWQSNISNQSNKASKKIHQMLEEYQTAIPTLQCLQADGLTERHWANIFHLLQMPYKAYHDITLKDILDHSGGLVENSSDIQQLVRKASSEQIIRQAIAELDQWGASAVLKTSTHADSTGEMVCIIKDFQDILNKVRSERASNLPLKAEIDLLLFSDRRQSVPVAISQELCCLRFIFRSSGNLGRPIGLTRPYSELFKSNSAEVSLNPLILWSANRLTFNSQSKMDLFGTDFWH